MIFLSVVYYAQSASTIRYCVTSYGTLNQ